MKHFFIRTAILLAISTMVGMTALATTTSRKVTFSKPVTVNGTTVKAGTYKVTFDDQTGMFTVLDGKKIVAQATARSEKIEGRYQGLYSTRINGMNNDLVSLTMNSDSKVIIDNSGGNMKEITP